MNVHDDAEGVTCNVNRTTELSIHDGSPRVPRCTGFTFSVYLDRRQDILMTRCYNSDRDKDPAIPSRVAELGLGTGAKEKSRVLQLTCCNPDPNLLSRSRSELTVMSSQEIPASQDPRR